MKLECEIGIGCKGRLNRAHIVHDGTTPGGADRENIIILCAGHHSSFDRKMKNFLSAPFHNSRENRINRSKEYSKEFISAKSFSEWLEKYTFLRTTVYHNRRTGRITITNGFDIQNGEFVPRLGER